MPDRYIVEAEGFDQHGACKALTLAIALAGVKGASVLLLTNTITALAPEVLHLVLTPVEQSDLADGRPVVVRGVPLRHDSIRTIRGYYVGDVAVALWPTREALVSLDTMLDCRAIIVVPWSSEHCDQWRGRWDPMVVRVLAADLDPA